MPDKCIRRGFCVEACPEGCHDLDEEGHRFDRGRCRRCGRCVATCYAGAMEVVGKDMSVSEVMEQVLAACPFYESSGGGLTISGGEPMSQFLFTRSLLLAAREKGLHTCVDTSGYSSFDKFLDILKLVDIFLYDLKERDADKHRKLTGVDGEPIIKNLLELDRAGAKIILRCPVIPGVNDRPDHFVKVAALVGKLDNVNEVRIMPYHPMGAAKWERMGKTGPVHRPATPDKEVVSEWIRRLQKDCKVPVREA